MPLTAAPGEKFSYSSGPGMQALACLVSRAVEQNLLADVPLRNARGASGLFGEGTYEAPGL